MYYRVVQSFIYLPISTIELSVLEPDPSPFSLFCCACSKSKLSVELFFSFSPPSPLLSCHEGIEEVLIRGGLGKPSLLSSSALIDCSSLLRSLPLLP